MDFVVAACARDLRPGALTELQAGSWRLAVANVDGRYFAVDNNCPHNGGPLGKGRLIGEEIECPWHGWRWNVVTGRAAWPPSDWRVRRFPVRLENGQIELPDL